MSRINDGGTAFPTNTENNQNPGSCYADHGMSLRAYLAAHSPITFREFLTGWRRTDESSTDEAMRAFADFRVRYADAMIAALQPTSQEQKQ